MTRDEQTEHFDHEVSQPSPQTQTSNPQPFDVYAEWYDAFNQQKDYASETRYLLERIGAWRSDVRSWVDVGCGTGAHLAALRSAGVRGEGVDVSPSMIVAARAAHPDILFQVASAQNFRLSSDRDVISMLFHAISYQSTDDDLRGAIRNISTHLAPHGLFVFDFWHTPAVLSDPPVPRLRKAMVEGRTLFRLTTPTEDRQRRLVHIEFEFRWDTPDGEAALREMHTMRHFEENELRQVLAAEGLSVVECAGWMTDRPLTVADWYGFVCAQRLHKS